MSNAHYVGRSAAPVPLRVRDQAREVVAVVAFSAVTASGLALALLLVASLGRQG
ncbi:MAG: hypothetical protein LT071_00625 [Nocardioides sp.]|nr:hypothetical protein [Nocardioides sp.]